MRNGGHAKPWSAASTASNALQLRHWRSQAVSFRIAARTILHLGAELISSDGIALYELIKNAFDARSPNVRISVVMALARRAQRDILGAIAQSQNERLTDAQAAELLAALKASALGHVIDGAPFAGLVRDAVAAADTLETLDSVVRDANSIVISDTGRGMSLSKLEQRLPDDRHALKAGSVGR